MALYQELTVGRDSVIVCEADEGIYDAYNKGISASTGDVLFF